MKLKYHSLIVIGCCLLMTAVAIPANCMGIFLKHVSQSLEINYASLSFYISIQYIAMIITLPLAGKLLAGAAMRRSLLIAVLCVTTALLLMSTAQSLSVFYIAGVLIGIGMGFTLLLPIPLLINAWFNKHNGLFIGIAYLFLSVGAAVFNPLGGAIIQHSSWRNGYLAFALIFALFGFLAILIIRRTPADKGLEPFGQKAVSEVIGMTRMQALRSPLFYMACLFAGILGILPTLMLHLPTYAAASGFTPIKGASVLSAILMGGALGKVATGLINDRFGIPTANITIIGTGILGTLAFIWAQSYTFMLLAGFLFGIGYSCSTVLPPLVVKAVFGTKDYSRIYSLVMIASAAGSGFGATFVSYIYNLTGSFYYIFISVIALMAFALLMGNTAYFLRPRKAES